MMNLIDTMTAQDNKARLKARYTNHKKIYPCGCEIAQKVDLSNGKVINSRRLQCDKFTAKEWIKGKRCDIEQIY